ncbi:universal stress protein [Dissulfurispira thermophila]|uniref:Universal stress protein n=2 Tax=root TaxID=1 RepID=A0A7G1H3Y5_9BACT|nr:universal stress protein [Dissulfurispira thermophila]BCB96861.1 universal stress protein [Dissulfurispira thermophila]
MYKRILVAFDGSRYSNKAVKEAVDLAKVSGAELLIVTAVDITDEFESQAPGLTDKMTEKAKKLLDKVTKKIAAVNIKINGEVHVGDPFDVIVNIAKRKKADLIVMGSHGRTGIVRLLMGSVAARVIGHAPCNVLIVKP